MKDWQGILTRHQRTLFMRRQTPELVWEKDCPVKAGDVIVLESRRTGIIGPNDSETVKEALGYADKRILVTPLVSIEITGVGRRKDYAHVAQYKLRDDRGDYLAPKSGYTSSASTSIDPDAPAIRGAEHDLIHREAKAKQTMSREVQRVRQQKLHLERRLQDERMSPRSQKAVVRALQTARRYLEQAERAA